MSTPIHVELQPRSRWVAFSASMFTHALVLISLGLLWKPVSRGTQAEPDRPIGIAFVKTLPDRTEYETPKERADAELESANAVGESGAEQGSFGTAPLAGTGVRSPLDLDGLLKSAIATPPPSAGGVSADATSTETHGTPGTSGFTSSPSNEGKKVKATLFGIEGYAHRFVYVIDRSESMSSHGGRPLAAAKRELMRSVRSLGPDDEFQVIFYNDRAVPLIASGQGLSILRGDRAAHSMVDRATGMVTGSGGTNHMEAMKLALRMGPQVIFLLTDARLPSLSRYQMGELLARAGASGTTIHTIEFGAEEGTPSESFLKHLAEASGGEYRYFNVAGL